MDPTEFDFKAACFGHRFDGKGYGTFDKETDRYLIAASCLCGWEWSDSFRQGYPPDTSPYGKLNWRSHVLDAIAEDVAKRKKNGA
jgi:hypothetical protein